MSTDKSIRELSRKELYSKFGSEEVGIHKKLFNINGEYYNEILMNLYI